MVINSHDASSGAFESMLKKQRTIVQVINSLGMNRGGLTRAVFRRARAVSSSSDLIFAVPSFQTDMESVFSEMRRESLIPAHVRLCSFHADIACNDREGKITPSRVMRLASQQPEADVTVEPNYGGQLERYFLHGRFVGLIQRNKNGKVRFAIDHAAEAPWFPLQRTVYDSTGRIRRRVFLDGDHKDRYQIFYNTAGGEYLASWIRQNGTPYRIVQFTKKEALTFDDMSQAHSMWFENLMRGLDEATVLCDEPATLFSLANRTPNAQRIATVHASHLMPTSTGELKPKAWLPKYMAVRDNVDTFVFLTRAQARDFTKRTYTDERRIVTIPHPFPGEIPTKKIERKNGLLVSVGRLDRDKQVDHVIRAVVMARKQVPNLRLQVFGNGDQMETLRQLIIKLDASDYISLEGYASDTQAVFASAEASVMASLHEGFGLALLESLVVGTPVISYETPFGPCELIRDGVNGLLVPLNNVTALSEAIAQSFKKPKRLKKLQDAAAQSVSGLSDDDWARSWDELIHRGSNGH